MGNYQCIALCLVIPADYLFTFVHMTGANKWWWWWPHINYYWVQKLINILCPMVDRLSCNKGVQPMPTAVDMLCVAMDVIESDPGDLSDSHTSKACRHFHCDLQYWLGLGQFQFFHFGLIQFLANVNSHSSSLYAIAPPSVVCPSVVDNARAPYSGGWNFPQYFYGIWYIGHPLISRENFTEIFPGDPPPGWGS